MACLAGGIGYSLDLAANLGAVSQLSNGVGKEGPLPGVEPTNQGMLLLAGHVFPYSSI
jgi:hypothetical protein